MGTRNLTAVYLDGKYRVAQYCQWDGYPEGVGAVCLDFLHRLIEKNELNHFVSNIRDCDFYGEELEEIVKRLHTDSDEVDEKLQMAFSRDVGPEILEYILEHGGLKLRNSITFAGNSLWCEWAYVIDLDNQTFEVYEGFNEDPLTENDRFHIFPAIKGYYPVKKVAEWKLSELPTREEFVKHFDDEGGVS